MSPWLCAGALALVVVVLGPLLVRSIRKFRRIYTPAHFAEVAAAVHGLKGQLASGDADPQRQPPAALTSAGVGIVYTTTDVDEGVQHHVSMSYAGAPLARGAALALIGFLLDRAGVAPERAVVFSTIETGVTHVAFCLSRAEHERWSTSAPEIADGAALRAQVRQAFETRRALLTHLEHVRLADLQPPG